MNKSDLIAALAKEADLPLRKAEEIVNLVFETMSKALIEGNRIEIRGFGSFMVKEYRGYTGRNPKTGEQILVTDKRLPFFKTGKELKEKVDAATKAME
jgi:integration host factor subunit beta